MKVLDLLVHHLVEQLYNDNYVTLGAMGARRNFSRGGANLWGGPQKICEGGPHFFRQALKYAYRGGGGGWVVLMPADFFSRGPQIY